MNPAPDADLHSVGKESFEWIVDGVARLAVKKAQTADKLQAQMNWVPLLSGASIKKTAKAVEKSVVKKTAKKQVKKSK
jgi:hypothetical protein